MTVQKTRKISIFKLILALLAIIIIVALLVLAYLFLTQKLINIGSSNMAPTLHRGSVVTFLPYAAFSYQPERWDMVLYKARGGETSVGRIVGMPQETIQLIDGELYINETIQPLPSELTQAGIRYLAADEFRTKKEGKIVTHKTGPDEYFILGDNTAASFDSRYVGPVPRESIISSVAKLY
ncbi:signal peptidase I [Amphritea pacifica]|uniref:Signal peptidase I n=1 Tax=Amphritea pacifica TaxID=2811233 RepID=A0ABS2W931_9GAMM|nr:signal peptidase I [Amphritea pacifica]MBN0988125.1 signal peptidase I [Amphritea pacifica]